MVQTPPRDMDQLTSPSVPRPPRSISVDEALALLADRRRRIILAHLSQNDKHRVEVEELVEVVNPRTEGINTKQAIWRTLHHVHLPKLDATGLIEYQPNRNIVIYQPSEPIESLIEFIVDELDPIG